MIRGASPILDVEKRVKLLQKLCRTFSSLDDYQIIRNFQSFYDFLVDQPLTADDFNQKIIDEPNDKGKTALWLLTHLTATRGNNLQHVFKFLQQVFKKVPIEKLNFNATSEESHHQGTSVLHLLSILAEKGYPEYLEKVFKSVPLKNLDFNTQIIAGPHKGQNVLIKLIRLSLRGQPQLLKQVLTEAPECLDFNIALEVSGGHTILSTLIISALQDHFEVLEMVFNLVPLEYLDFNKQVTFGPHEGQTPLWLLIQLAIFKIPAQSHFLKKILHSPQIDRLDFNVPIKSGSHKGMTPLLLLSTTTLVDSQWAEQVFSIPSVVRKLNFNVATQSPSFKGQTPLWLLADTALKGYPHPLECLLSSEYELKKLDFNAKDASTPSECNSLLLDRNTPVAQLIENLNKHLGTQLTVNDCLKSADTNNTHGLSVLFLLVEAAINGFHKPLELLLRNVPIHQLDFKSRVESGKFQGFSVLLQLAILTFNNPKYLESIFNHFEALYLKPDDFNAKIKRGPHEGATVLWWLASAALAGHEHLLEKVFLEISIENLDFNATHKENGITVLLLLTSLALNGKPQLLEKVLNNVPLNKLNFNAQATHKNYFGQTPLWHLAALAGNGHPKLLEKVLYELPDETLLTLDFNLPTKTCVDRGITPLLLIAQATLNNHTNVLERILNVVPPEKLNFNAVAGLELWKGKSVFWHIAAAALNDSSKSLDIVLRKVPIKQLNFNIMPKSGEHKNKSILFILSILAVKGNIAPLRHAITSVSPDKLDFNLPVPQNGEMTPLSLIAYAAIMGFHQALDEVINLIPIERLNFDVKTVAGKRTFTPAETLGPRFMLFIEISKIAPIIQSILDPFQFNHASSLVTYFDKINALADKAYNDGFTDAYHFTATFYHKIGHIDNFKIMVEKMKANNLYTYEENCFYLAEAIFNNSQYEKYYADNNKLSIEQAHKKLLLEAAQFAQDANGFKGSKALKSKIQLHINKLDKKTNKESTKNKLTDTVVSQEEINKPPAPTFTVLSKTLSSKSKKSEIEKDFKKLNLSTNAASPVKSRLLHPQSDGTASPRSLLRKNGRTPDTQELHGKIICAIDSKNKKQLKARIKGIQEFVNCNAYPTEILVAKSVNGYTHLYDIMHLPFERQNDNPFAIKISLALFDTITELSSKHLDQKLWRTLLCEKNNLGFNHFHQAVNSGSLALVKKFTEIIRNTFKESTDDVFKRLAQDTTKFFIGNGWKQSNEQASIYEYIKLFLPKNFSFKKRTNILKFESIRSSSLISTAHQVLAQNLLNKENSSANEGNPISSSSLFTDDEIQKKDEDLTSMAPQVIFSKSARTNKNKRRPKNSSQCIKEKINDHLCTSSNIRQLSRIRGA